MLIKNRDIKEIDGYYPLLIETGENQGAFIMTKKSNWNVLDKYNRLLVPRIDYANASFASSNMMSKAMSYGYDYIIFDSNDEYVISTSEKLRVYIKELAVVHKKNITGAYKYYNNGKLELKMFYSTPSFDSSEIYNFEDNDIEIDKLLDFVSYKHCENNMEKDIAIKILK